MVFFLCNEGDIELMLRLLLGKFRRGKRLAGCQQKQQGCDDNRTYRLPSQGGQDSGNHADPFAA